MSAISPIDLRSVLLSVIQDQQPREQTGASLQTSSVLGDASKRAGLSRDTASEQALLTQLHDLFRTGYLAWGLNLSNPNPPFFHVTDAGRRLLSRLSRDPGNPAGFKAHLSTVATLNPVARSYIDESVECYVAGHHKASAVMVGGAAESLILELRDAIVARLSAISQKAPKDLEDWRVKKILDAVQQVLALRRSLLPSELREALESYWPAFTQQIRAVRNEAGHPSSVDPVTAESVQASLLIFPELASLQGQLLTWVREYLS